MGGMPIYLRMVQAPYEDKIETKYYGNKIKRRIQLGTEK